MQRFRFSRRLVMREMRSGDETDSTAREWLIADLAELGIGAGALAKPPNLSSPPRTEAADRAEQAVMEILRPMLKAMSKRRYVTG